MGFQLIANKFLENECKLNLCKLVHNLMGYELHNCYYYILSQHQRVFVSTLARGYTNSVTAPVSCCKYL